MGHITKEQHKRVVFVTAHNSGVLSEQVQLNIDAFDLDTYRRILGVALQQREHADLTDEPGGGSRSAAYLTEAMEYLEYILSH